MNQFRLTQFAISLIVVAHFHFNVISPMLDSQRLACGNIAKRNATLNADRHRPLRRYYALILPQGSTLRGGRVMARFSISF